MIEIACMFCCCDVNTARLCSQSHGSFKKVFFCFGSRSVQFPDSDRSNPLSLSSCQGAERQQTVDFTCPRLLSWTTSGNIPIHTNHTKTRQRLHVRGFATFNRGALVARHLVGTSQPSPSHGQYTVHLGHKTFSLKDQRKCD